MSAKVLVSDTNIWIDLHRGGLLKTVFRLPFQFVTTSFVWEELRQPRGTSLVEMGLEVIGMEGEEILQLASLTQTLNNSSLADVSCYHLAKTRGWVLLTGDGQLRTKAEAKNVMVHGVLWIMDQLYARSLVAPDTLANALDTMLQAGARLPENECRRRITTWSQCA